MALPNDPEGAAFYATQRRRVNDTYNVQTQQNTLQHQFSDLNYAQRLQALQTRFNQGYESFPGKFASRGVLDSGIYAHALQNLYSNYGQSQGNVIAQQNMANQGFGVNQGNLDTTHTGALADLEQMEQARREALAAALQAAQ